MKKIGKALTFRASSIGDCLMGKYLLENIHAAHPDARCGIVVADRGGMIRDLLAAYPWIEVIEANRRSPRTVLPLLEEFYGSDIVVTQYAGKHGGSFGLASKFAARMLAKRDGLIGFVDASPWNRFLYDALLPFRTDRAVVEHDREALRAAGLGVPIPFPTLSCVRDAAVPDAFGLKAGEFVIVHFFAGSAKRSTSPEKSRELLIELRKTLPENMTLVLSGSAADRPLALALSDGTGAKVVAGEATLQQMLNLIDASRAVVSMDTGVAHMAAQLGKPLVVMRTCLGPNWWFEEQYGAGAPITVLSHDAACSGGHTAKDYPDCINGIDMHDVASRTAAIIR